MRIRRKIAEQAKRGQLRLHTGYVIATLTELASALITSVLGFAGDWCVHQITATTSAHDVCAAAAGAHAMMMEIDELSDVDFAELELAFKGERPACAGFVGCWCLAEAANALRGAMRSPV